MKSSLTSRKFAFIVNFMVKAEKKRSTQVLPLHKREGCPWAERRPGEGTAEGSFGAGWLNGRQQVSHPGVVHVTE